MRLGSFGRFSKEIPIIAFCVVALVVGIAVPADADNKGRQGEWWRGWSMDDPRLSQPIYDKSVTDTLSLKMSDGVVLQGWVTRPVVPKGVRVPVILHLSPYLAYGPAPPPDLIEGKYAKRGYALVDVSVRGTGYSGGCIDYQGKRDRRDFVEILDAITSQPWAANAVGGIGASWAGHTLNSGLVMNHPALRTIVPVAAWSDAYRFPFLNGVQWYYTGYSYNLYSSVFAAPNNSQDPSHVQALTERACPDYIETQRAGLVSGALGTRNEWWDERDFDRFLKPPPRKVGVLLVHGQNDGVIRTDYLPTWLSGLSSAGYTVRALLGQWNHQWPDEGNVLYNEVAGIPINRRQDAFPLWDVTLLRWFDYWLKGKDTNILKMPPVVTQDSSYTWHEEKAFSPSRSRRFYLDDGGTLSSGPGKGQGIFVDNEQPLQASVARGPEAAYYVTEPLEDDLHYMGSVRTTLDLTHSSATGHVGVSLYDVDGDEWTPITYGFANLALRNGLYSYDPVVPGERFKVEVPVLPYDVVIPAGHRLGVAIGNQVDSDRSRLATPYLHPPSGGVTILHHGRASYIELRTLSSIAPAGYPEPERYSQPQASPPP
jgi:predicted acyl esterase